jgi:hypothetical protein
MLLTIADVPGEGWKLSSEAGWRSGSKGRRGPIARRAYRSGTFQVLRRFVRESDPPVGLLVEIFPMGTSADAESAVRQARSTVVPLGTGIVRVSEREIEDIDVPGVENPLIWERLNARGDRRGYERFICGRVETTTFMVTSAAWGDGWPWGDLVVVASAQATKVRDQLEIERANGLLPEL